MNIDFLEKDVDITSLSNFKTKATAKYYYELKTEADLDKLSILYKFCKENNLQLIFIGGGTNLLFAFDKFEGVIVNNCLKGWEYNDKTKLLTTLSNESISNLAKNIENDFNQSLWHRFIGLPGTVGGAVCGNAGCFGLETENNFKEALVYDLETGQTEVFNKNDMCFSYRSSFIKNKDNYFIIKCVFDFSEKIEKYHSDADNLDFRENKQPKGNTCGSFFKNPNKKDSAGSLIEEVGLKGHKIGTAFFSPLHANFLINSGNGSYKDLLTLISLAQKKVKLHKGYELIPEVRIIFNK